MLWLLNIGKRASVEWDELPVSDSLIMTVLHRYDFDVLRYTVEESDTEPTAVVLVDVLRAHGLATGPRLWAMARDLLQDCIAAVPIKDGMLQYERGGLFGPRASRWGHFDKSKFLGGDKYEQHNRTGRDRRAALHTGSANQH